ncbi:MAG: hypothetical protein COB59_11420 [Rhodospirillaceae bacterium]|nr:MAG: hypothetical protein COB59_11420 [Rhodospirillaceae bacterium]
MFETEPQDIKDWLDNDQAILIDVREPREIAQFSIPGAVHNPMSSFNLEAIPSNSDKKIVFVCAHGMRSKQVGSYLLQQNHVSEVYNMTGGVAAWVRAGLPGQN